MRAVVAALCVSGILIVPANAKERVKIDYVLPAATITAGVAQRITSCPLSAEAQADLKRGEPQPGVEFTYKVVLAGKLAPRRLVRLDAESGFLVDRETKVHFNEDWYLKDFNGKTTGQGGPLLVSLIKAGAAIYTMGSSPILGVGATVLKSGRVEEGVARPTPRYFATNWYLECKPDVVKSLKALQQRRDDVAALEARVIGGDLSAATQELLVLRRGQVGDLESSLTINAILKGGLQPTLQANGKVDTMFGRIAPADFDRLLQMTEVTRQVTGPEWKKDGEERTVMEVLKDRARDIPGLHGFQVSVTPDAKLAKWFGCDPEAKDAAACAADVLRTTPKDTRDLVFLRPVPATVKLWPNPTDCAADTVCAADETWVRAKSASGTAEVKLPQLSRLFTMRTGGSIFGGRTVGAEFGPMGEPTMLQYNIGSSGKDVAGVIDAGVAGAQSIRDAEGNATKRKLEQFKNARDLQDLLEELDKDAG